MDDAAYCYLTPRQVRDNMHSEALINPGNSMETACLDEFVSSQPRPRRLSGRATTTTIGCLVLVRGLGE